MDEREVSKRLKKNEGRRRRARAAGERKETRPPPPPSGPRATAHTRALGLQDAGHPPSARSTTHRSSGATPRGQQSESTPGRVMPSRARTRRAGAAAAAGPPLSPPSAVAAPARVVVTAATQARAREAAPAAARRRRCGIAFQQGTRNGGAGRGEPAPCPCSPPAASSGESLLADGQAQKRGTARLSHPHSRSPRVLARLAKAPQ